MTYRLIDPASMTAGRGPHPAASPFDKRVGEALGITAFEVYQVELPAGAETVLHDHLEDRSEDVYAIVGGTGWVVVDSDEVPVKAGQFIAVTVESSRMLRAGRDGLIFIAICSTPD